MSIKINGDIITEINEDWLVITDYGDKWKCVDKDDAVQTQFLIGGVIKYRSKYFGDWHEFQDQSEAVRTEL